MTEPENHTLQLLREIRGAIAASDAKIDRVHSDLKNRIEDLARLIAGESIIGRYAAAGVDERIQALEDRMSALEGRR